MVGKSHQKLAELSLRELDELWEKVKKENKPQFHLSRLYSNRRHKGCSFSIRSKMDKSDVNFADFV